MLLSDVCTLPLPLPLPPVLTPTTSNGFERNGFDENRGWLTTCLLWGHALLS